ncbi:MAG: flavin monoamine oxidase family protein [Candidatus Binatia bacterium]
MTDVVVIGAGMAGVTAARELRRGGFSVVVVEGRDRVGGRVRTVRDFCTLPVEGGAEFIHGADAEFWPDVRGAGLEVRRCPYTWNSMFNIGSGAHWLPRLLLDPRLWRVFTILRAIRRLKPPDLSAHGFLEKRAYRGRAWTMAQLVLSTHLPGSVDEIGMLGLLEDNVLKLERATYFRVADGYDRVPAYIAQGLDVRYRFIVREIEWHETGVAVRSAGGQEVSARAAVCTLPLGVLKSAAVRFIPELPESKRSAFQALEMGPVLKLLLRFEEPFWPKWLASLVCGTGPVTLYWPVFSGLHSAPPVITAYCTGPRAAALSQRSEEEAADTAVQDLRRHFPKAMPRLAAYRRIDWTTDPLSCGGYTFVKPGGTGARAQLAAPGPGALFWAGSATTSAPIAACVQGAYVSGLRAAHAVRTHF